MGFTPGVEKNPVFSVPLKYLRTTQVTWSIFHFQAAFSTHPGLFKISLQDSLELRTYLLLTWFAKQKCSIDLGLDELVIQRNIAFPEGLFGCVF